MGFVGRVDVGIMGIMGGAGSGSAVGMDGMDRMDCMEGALAPPCWAVSSIIVLIGVLSH